MHLSVLVPTLMFTFKRRSTASVCTNFLGSIYVYKRLELFFCPLFLCGICNERVGYGKRSPNFV